MSWASSMVFFRRPGTAARLSAGLVVLLSCYVLIKFVENDSLLSWLMSLVDVSC